MTISLHKKEPFGSFSLMTGQSQSSGWHRKTKGGRFGDFAARRRTKVRQRAKAPKANNGGPKKPAVK